eukprot:scaffold308700_cov35-Tisochrysis_lutea.AAC.1
MGNGGFPTSAQSAIMPALPPSSSLDGHPPHLQSHQAFMTGGARQPRGGSRFFPPSPHPPPSKGPLYSPRACKPPRVHLTVRG